MSTHDIAETLGAQPNSLSQLIPQVLRGKHDESELLLFTDQLEELVTQVSSSHRVPFIEMLCQAMAAGRCRIVATLRADFYHEMIQLSGSLVRLLQTGSYPLGAPDSSSLYEMIVRPAERAGLRYERELAQTILRETGDAPGGLALMAYLLDELYRRRTGDRYLTMQAYRELGGVAGVIGERAEEVFRNLSPLAQEVLPNVFRHLVEVDDRGTATRRRALQARIVPPELTEAADELLKAFVAARLLVTDSEAGQPAVEVAHEALLRNWNRLATWIEQSQLDLRLLRQVKAAAAEWDQNERKDAFRWPDERLRPVFAMIKRLSLSEDFDLNAAEQEFIRPEAKRLLEEIKDPSVPHLRRLTIGERFCELGDSRPGVGLRPDGLPDIDWCPVDAGEGVQHFEVEIDRRKARVELPFSIARYLVTFSQYQAFLDAPDGYRNPDHDWFEGLSADDNARRIADSRYKLGNHPHETVNSGGRDRSLRGDE